MNFTCAHDSNPGLSTSKFVADPPLLRQRNILEGVLRDLLVPVATIVPEAVVAVGVLHLRPVLLVREVRCGGGKPSRAARSMHRRSSRSTSLACSTRAGRPPRSSPRRRQPRLQVGRRCAIEDRAPCIVVQHSVTVALVGRVLLLDPPREPLCLRESLVGGRAIVKAVGRLLGLGRLLAALDRLLVVRRRRAIARAQVRRASRRLPAPPRAPPSRASPSSCRRALQPRSRRRRTA